MNSRTKSEIRKRLAKLYPKPRSELNFRNNYELLICVLLSAQCTDKKVNEVTPKLFAKYPNFKSLSQASLSAVESIIRPINYYRTKSRNVLALADRVTSLHKGRVPKSFDELTELPGVGRKTANVILCELGVAHTFPVDTHVFRVSRRLGLAKGKTPDEVEQELMQAFPSKSWRELHHRFIFHGRRVCKAQNPQCRNCNLRALCPSAIL